MAIYFYMSDSRDGWRNLATDGFFLENLPKEDILLYLYVNANAVIIGKNQNAWRECRLDAMERDGVQLVRRHTGGGAVYHDEQNLNFSFIMSEENYDVKRQLGVIRKTVAALGLTAELSGRNDILIDGKKFSGNAFASSKGMKAHHGTLLINTDLSKLSDYLKVSEEKMRAKGVSSVVSRVCNLCQFDGKITLPQVTRILARAYREEYGEFEEFRFRKADLERIEELYALQASWDWRFGKTLAFDYQIEQRFSFGEMQFLFQVKDGKVLHVSVFSDALDTGLTELVERCLTGARFTPQDLAEKLSGNTASPALPEIAEYIRGISF